MLKPLPQDRPFWTISRLRKLYGKGRWRKRKVLLAFA